MTTRDEVFKEYQEALDKIGEQAHEAMAKARFILQEQLKSLQIKHHEELKAIRAITQKIRDE